MKSSLSDYSFVKCYLEGWNSLSYESMGINLKIKMSLSDFDWFLKILFGKVDLLLIYYL